MKLIFYHGTKEDIWTKIQKEGVLWSVTDYPDYRYTYLSPRIEVAKSYGPVLLRVKYEPHGVGVRDHNGKCWDNWGFNPPEDMTCWQFSVFRPIPLCDISRIYNLSDEK